MKVLRKNDASAAGAAAVVAAVLVLPRVLAALPFSIACGFRNLTGMPCPFCGLTRSLTAAAGGDFGRALTLYPLSLLMFAAAVLLGAGMAVCLVSGRTAWMASLPAGRTQAAAGSLLLLNWMYLLAFSPA